MKRKSIVMYSMVLALFLALRLAPFPASVFAAPSATLQGLVFDDIDLDGALDGNEHFSSLTGMGAVLTSPSGAVAPMDITIRPDGTFGAYDDSGAPFAFLPGTYVLTISNWNIDAAYDTARGFTPTTSPIHSDADSWYMDIPQGVPADENSPGIAADQSYAVYTFEVTNASGDIAVGVGMADPANVVFIAESGFDPGFGDHVARVLRGTALGYENLPPVKEEGALPGYDPGSLMWRLDRDVTLRDSTPIPAGMPIPYDLLAEVTVMEDLAAFASLAPLYYGITYDYAGGIAPAEPNPYGYTVEDMFPIAIPNVPTREGYLFAGWTADYEDAALEDLTTADPGYSVPPGTTGAIALTAVWSETPAEPALYTVVYEPGEYGLFSAQTTANLAAGAATPAAPYVTGGGKDWRFAGWLPARSATVTGSVVYVAQWERTYRSRDDDNGYEYRGYDGGLTVGVPGTEEPEEPDDSALMSPHTGAAV